MEKGYTYKINKEKDYLYKVEVEVEPSRVKEAYTEALKELGKDVKIQGFRPGKAPAAMIEAKVGNEAFSHSIRHLLSDIAVEIVDSEKLNPVTPLDYSVEKASVDGNVAFSFSFTNYPEVKLADLSKLTVEKPDNAVSEEDIDKVIANLRNAENEKNKGKKDETKEEKDKEAKKISGKGTEKKDKKTTELTDAEVKTLGFEGVTTVAELRKMISERLQDIQGQEQQARFEQSALEVAIKASDIQVPQALIDRQAEQLVEAYMAKIKDLDVKPEEFLQAQGLTKESLKKQKRIKHLNS
jgi:FKBP-type peptidyl-prolyl cis-trans isomerase (trigger factor)